MTLRTVFESPINKIKNTCFTNKLEPQESRLGTKMFERAIMLKARLALFPASHPAYQLLAVALSSGQPTWAAKVHDIQNCDCFLEPIPDITDVLSLADVAEARSCKAFLRSCLAFYKRRHVSPVLVDYDTGALSAACDLLNWPYAAFQIDINSFPEDLYHVDWGPDTWHLYRAWALARATGRFALCLFGADFFCTSMESCPLCGESDVRLDHALFSCIGTRDLHTAWSMVAYTPSDSAASTSWEVLRMDLFAGRMSFLDNDPDKGQARILFVGGVVRRFARARLQAEAPASIESLIATSRRGYGV